ncbi:MAG: hypothetical protein N2050_00375 [Flavobacteriales bacterium]|nr:hypothetical protein [Flavobacteriales bacterium]
MGPAEDLSAFGQPPGLWGWQCCPPHLRSALSVSLRAFLHADAPAPLLGYVCSELNRRTPGLQWFPGRPAEGRNEDSFIFSYIGHAASANHFFQTCHLNSQKNEALPSLKENLRQALHGDPTCDIPGLIFHLLARSEEWIPGCRDALGRHLPEFSLLYQAKVHEEPVIESRLIPLLIRPIQEKFPGWKMETPRASLIHTFDIDHAYAHHGKPLSRQIARLALGMWKRDLPALAAQLRSFIRREADPFFSYPRIWELAGKKSRILCFWQTVSGEPLNNNIPLRGRAARRLIKEMAQHVEVGLHPSTHQLNDIQAIAHEKSRLEAVLERTVTSARCHFLGQRFPDTYRAFVSFGIKEDFSMGWAHIPGFRAGTCQPFQFFDVENGSPTALTIYPTPCMEGVLHDRMGLRDAAFLETFRHYATVVHQYGGVFVNHWHNHTIAPMGIWADGSKLFEQSLKMLEEIY